MSSLNPITLKKYLRTKNDANYLVLLLERLSDGLFTENINPDEVMAREVPYELSALLRRMIEENKLNPHDKTQLNTFITQLKEAIVALPLIEITLAIVPTEEVVMAIHEWFLRTYQKAVVLNIAIDPALLAGSVIRFNGAYRDYSLKKQLETIHI